MKILLKDIISFLPTIFALFGGVALAGGTLFVDISENNVLAASLKWGGAIVGTIACFVAAFQTDTYRKRLERLNSKIQDLITGGDSFAELAIANTMGNNQRLLMAIHHGDSPIYNVSVRIVHLQSITPTNYQSMNGTVINVGELSPNMATTAGLINFPAAQQVDYNIFFSARNGTWLQLIRMRQVAGTMVVATKIDDSNGKTVYENINPNFPLNSQGQVSW